MIEFVRAAKNTTGGDNDGVLRAGSVQGRGHGLAFGRGQDPDHVRGRGPAREQRVRERLWVERPGRAQGHGAPCAEGRDPELAERGRAPAGSGVAIFGVQCISTARGFWDQIRTRFLLQNFASSSQMILVSVHAQTGGDEAVRSYAQGLEKSGTMTRTRAPRWTCS